MDFRNKVNRLLSIKASSNPCTRTPIVPKGTRLVFENEADDSPDREAGDLYVEVQERYRRRGADTFRVEVLSSREALRWMRL
ncbi:hypothetical protein V1515DRAFT_194244 [Lipomyces mesembrius]